jgi:hypothetical protein
MADANTNVLVIVGISETDPREIAAEASKVADKARVTLNQVREQLRAAERLGAMLDESTAVFESIAQRLLDATFRASDAATRAAASHAVVVSFVEELGDLARRSLKASSALRRELRDYQMTTAPALAATQQADTALGALTHAIKRVADRQAQAQAQARPPAPRVIEVETTRPFLTRESARESDLAFFKATSIKSGGYKN